VHHGAKITDGPNAGAPVTTALVEQTIDAELAAVRSRVDDTRFSAYERAAKLMRKLIDAPTFPDFLTVPAYAEVLAEETF
jgi:malate synthase